MNTGQGLAIQSPARRPRRFLDLVGAFGAAESGRNPRLSDGPVHDQLGNCFSEIIRDPSQLIDQVLILVPLFSLKHRILWTSVAFPKDVIPAQLARQESFEQRPVNDDGYVVFQDRPAIA